MSERRFLAILTAAAALVRGVLVLRGGQLLFPDEVRYWRGGELVHALGVGGWRPPYDIVLGHADHVAFTVVSALPAALQEAWRAATGTNVQASLWLPSLFFAACSTACVPLVHAIARRAGAGTFEARLAATLLAASTSLTYFARHLVPYDVSLLLLLVGLWLGLGTRARDSFGCGLALGASVYVYNGAGPAAALTLAAVTLLRAATLRRFLVASACGAAGILIFPVAFELLSRAGGLPSFIDRMRSFSATVIQGSMSEGAALPFAYLWHAEGPLLFVWLLAPLAFVLARANGEALDASLRRRALLWGALLAALYLALAVPSTLLHRAVVYGRLVRYLVPVLCLLSASALAGPLSRVRSRAVVPALGVLLALVALWNLREPLRQRFPADVASEAATRFGPLATDLTVETTNPPRPPLAPGARRVLLNVSGLLWPVLGPRAAPRGAVLLESRHPLQYLPYQYEAWTPQERAILRTAGISMRVVDRDAPSSP